MMLTCVLFLGCIAVPASAAGQTMYGIGFVDASSLRLRRDASSSSSTLAYAPRSECVVVISKEGSWYKVNYNLQIGYMHEDYLDVLTTENAELGYGKVTGSNVNVRSGPSTAYKKVTVASAGDNPYIIGLNKGWYKVILNGSIGYIRSDYVELTEIPYENKASSNSPRFFRQGKSTGVAPSAAALSGSTASDATASGSTQESSSPSVSTPVSVTGAQILAEAKKYLGTPYVYGGASPSGFDCSGFVYYVLKQMGFSPYRTPADQYRMGSSVSRQHLQPCDIVFFADT